MENIKWEAGHKYVFILKQRIQTAYEQYINRIEIDYIQKETKKKFILLGGKRIEKSLIVKMIDTYPITIVNTQFFIERIEAVLI